MKRKEEAFLADWLVYKGRKPLIIRGARQVGKSTLVRNFAASQGLTLVEVNLERHFALSPFFQKRDLHQILREIEGLTGQSLSQGRPLLFLDEIQAVPEAIAALRYFFEDHPELPVIAAGSLLEFALSEREFSMPVGRVEFLYLGPMQFEEVLEAQGEHQALQALRTFDLQSSLSTTLNEKLLQHYRDFLFVGGMPEAVQAWINGSTPDQVQAIQTHLIETFQADFAKYAKKDSYLMLRQVFQYAARAIGEKVKYTAIDPTESSRSLKAAIRQLSLAGLLAPIYYSDCAGIPLGAGINDLVYKLFVLDVGLLNRLNGVTWQNRSVHLTTEGECAEQFVAQHLLYRRIQRETPQVYYWLREKKGSQAEIDFVFSLDDQIIPVEVKSGKSGSLKSLQIFMKEKPSAVAVRFDQNVPSVQPFEEKKLLSLPLYAVGQAERVLRG